MWLYTYVDSLILDQTRGYGVCRFDWPTGKWWTRWSSWPDRCHWPQWARRTWWIHRFYRCVHFVYTVVQQLCTHSCICAYWVHVIKAHVLCNSIELFIMNHQLYWISNDKKNKRTLFNPLGLCKSDLYSNMTLSAVLTSVLYFYKNNLPLSNGGLNCEVAIL